MVDRDKQFTAGLVGTVRLNAIVAEETYTVIIDDQSYSYTTPTEGTSPEQLLNSLGSAIPAKFNPIIYKTSIELSSDTPFELDVKDTQSNALLNSYQDTVLNPSLLANPTAQDRLVEVVGDSSAAADNYFLKFDEGTWEETVSPLVDVEIDARTMPHRLYINNQGTWQFGPIDYVDRLVGDEDNNPTPSFIGTPINASFYYNNRLGFLSGANVIMSQARDVYNFFKKSQLILGDGDPIDLNANSTRPVELFEVVTQPQGVLLFGTRQQFWLAAQETGVVTPTASSVQTICSYEADKRISPLDIGTTIGFVSKTPDYSKLMIMQGQGSDIDPVVVEISKVVTGWLPNTINRMAVSPQNSFVVLTGKDDEYLYIYRFYNDGQEDRMQAWTRWKMPGPVQALQVINDMIAMVTMNGGRYSVSMMSLNSLDKSGMQLSEDPNKPGSPYLDFLVRPESTLYDAETGETKFYVPFPLLPEKQAQMVLTLPGMVFPSPVSYIGLFENMRQLPRSTEDDAGYWSNCTQGTDDTGDYFALRGDFTEYSAGVSVGYQYEYEVTLPKFYYKISNKNNAADYTATLIINRIKFAVGMTGGVTFKLKAQGSDEWVDIQHVTDANYYEADMDPLEAETVMTVPINQRNKNFQLKVTSDLPFPVSLVSMMWEGQYTPRFYRRT